MSVVPTSVVPIDPLRFAPTRERPLRAKRRLLAASQGIQPHSHPWAQIAFSATGVIRMTAGCGTFLVPPTRAVWIPSGIEHVVHVVEDAELRTLYLHQEPGATGPRAAALDALLPGPSGVAADWPSCRVLEVSPLLRELVGHLPTGPGDAAPTPRELLLSALVLDELRQALPLPVGLAMPADKRLRALCEAVLDDPARWPTLEDWARDAGASPRTAARLFRSELGTTFLQWRQQVLLARGLTLAASGLSMASIAAELGYSSPSAFGAMVRRSVGQPAGRFFRQQQPPANGRRTAADPARPPDEARRRAAPATTLESPQPTAL